MRFLAALFFLVSSSLAFAGISEPFSTEKFQTLQKANATYVVGFHSKWCGTCRRQKPAVEALLKTNEFAHIAGLMADFGQHRDARKTLRVGAVSTLVLMKGEKEIARAVGVTDKNDIAAFLRKAPTP